MLLPKVKLKSIVSFPAAVFGGAGIAVRKENGSFYFDLDFNDFAPPVATVPDPANQNMLLWDSVTGKYTLAPISALNNVPASSDIYLTGAHTAVWPGRILNVSDDVQMTASNTDPNGNYTPEGWGNVSAYTFNWTPGALGTATGARTPLLANVFFKHPSSPSNAAGYYASAILTCNIYTDDNGALGAEKGDAFGLATVTYLKSTVKHWAIALGAEFDFNVEAGASVLRKIGCQVSSFAGGIGPDAVQGSQLDTAFLVNASTGCVGFKNGYTAENSAGNGNPFSSDGTLLKTVGPVTMQNAVDVSSATVTGYLLNGGQLKITGQGAYQLNLTAALAGDIAAVALNSHAPTQHIFTSMGRFGLSADLYTGVCGLANDFMTGTVAGDAVVAYSGSLCFGFLGAPPHMKISGGVANFALSPTVPQALAADNSAKAASTSYVDAATFGLRGHLSGYQLSNNAVTPNSKIDVAGGYCRDQNFNRYNIFCGGLTKDLAANWAAGNAGGLDTGAKAINTWYFLHAIYNPATLVSDVLFSASPSAPTLPSGYTAFRRLRGAVLTDPSGNIIRFVQKDSTFKWSVPVVDFNAIFSDTLAHLRKLSTPLGLRTTALIHGRAIVSTTGQSIATIFTDPAMADTVSDFVLAQQIGNFTISPFAQLQIVTDTLSQIRVRSNLGDAGTQLTIVTEGWIDTGEF